MFRAWIFTAIALTLCGIAAVPISIAVGWAEDNYGVFAGVGTAFGLVLMIIPGIAWLIFKFEDLLD